jgi:hypothetical protein
MESLILYQSPYNKVRIGKDNDGGYVICNLPNYYDLFISGGISNDISFEIDFLQKYKDKNNNIIKCYAFDGTISQLPVNNAHNINFIKKNLGNIETDDLTNLSSYIDESNNSNKYNNIFMKIDIEGHEFRLLPYLIDNNYMNKIKQLVVEIHTPADIEMFPDYFAGLSDIKNENLFKLLNNINKTHTLVHFHGNNGCNTQVIDNIKLPHVFECTYIRNDYVKKKIKNIEPLPTKLDMKNIKDKTDFNFDYYPFCNM